jgi:diguanylate cyclase (GGDEF)-like protein
VKILIAEDNAVFRQFLETMLGKWDYDVISARDGAQAWKILEGEHPPQLAILDWMMPRLNGLDVCRRIRSLRPEPYIYTILLTAKDSQKELIEGMEAGADDYLRKPFDAHELRVRLRAGRRILDLQTELVLAGEALRLQAMQDPLTGLCNRTAIFGLLQRELNRAHSESSSLALVMADIDRFKDVNDTMGHLAGDAVLREAAQRMKSRLRSDDAIGRYGGEEFLFVLPGCGGSCGAKQAERIRHAISSEPFHLPEGSISVTCSLGVSCIEKNDSIDPDQLIRLADMALYAAKRKGRNRVEIAYAATPGASHESSLVKA